MLIDVGDIFRRVCRILWDAEYMFGVMRRVVVGAGKALLVLLVTLAITGLTNEPYPVLPKGFYSAEFTRVDKMADLPAAVRTAINSALHGDRIAERNERYEATDVVMDTKLPTRRLIFAGRTERMWFLYYEHGGIGWHTHVVVLEPDSGGVPRITGNISMAADKVSSLKRLRSESKRYPEHRIAYEL